MKDALVRSLRTFCQTLAGSLIAIPVVTSLNMADINGFGQAIGVAGIGAAFAAVISFLQNVSNVDPLPK